MAYRTLNPFNAQTTKTYPDISDGDLEDAISRADAAYDAWSTKPFPTGTLLSPSVAFPGTFHVDRDTAPHEQHELPSNGTQQNLLEDDPTMPLVKIDAFEGRSDAEVKRLRAKPDVCAAQEDGANVLRACVLARRKLVAGAG